VEAEAIGETVETQDYRWKIAQMIEYDQNRNQVADDKEVSFIDYYRILPSPPYFLFSTGTKANKPGTFRHEYRWPLYALSCLAILIGIGVGMLFQQWLDRPVQAKE
jgi:hypothetical protein